MSYLVFITKAFYPQGGVADLVGATSSLEPEYLHPLIRNFVGSNEIDFRWTSGSIYVSIICPETLDWWGAELDLLINNNSISNKRYTGIKVNVLKYLTYTGVQKQMEMIPGFTEVDWFEVLGYASEDDHKYEDM